MSNLILEARGETFAILQKRKIRYNGLLLAVERKKECKKKFILLIGYREKKETVQRAIYCETAEALVFEFWKFTSTSKLKIEKILER